MMLVLQALCQSPPTQPGLQKNLGNATWYGQHNEMLPKPRRQECNRQRRFCPQHHAHTGRSSQPSSFNASCAAPRRLHCASAPLPSAICCSVCFAAQSWDCVAIPFCTGIPRFNLITSRCTTRKQHEGSSGSRTSMLLESERKTQGTDASFSCDNGSGRTWDNRGLLKSVAAGVVVRRCCCCCCPGGPAVVLAGIKLAVTSR
jgi:hypothetical protein